MRSAARSAPTATSATPSRSAAPSPTPITSALPGSDTTSPVIAAGTPVTTADGYFRPIETVGARRDRCLAGTRSRLRAVIEPCEGAIAARHARAAPPDARARARVAPHGRSPCPRPPGLDARRCASSRRRRGERRRSSDSYPTRTATSRWSCCGLVASCLRRRRAPGCRREDDRVVLELGKWTSPTSPPAIEAPRLPGWTSRSAATRGQYRADPAVGRAASPVFVELGVPGGQEGLRVAGAPVGVGVRAAGAAARRLPLRVHGARRAARPRSRQAPRTSRRSPSSSRASRTPPIRFVERLFASLEFVDARKSPSGPPREDGHQELRRAAAGRRDRRPYGCISPRSDTTAAAAKRRAAGRGDAQCHGAARRSARGRARPASLRRCSCGP